MNFVFISPNFPRAYWNFCDRLHRDGVTVLGVGDCPYDALEPGLKNALTEYYKVDTLENYDQVFRAVAYFSYRYGKIDWLESNNEYWLEQDARLRTDFHITTGVDSEAVAAFKSKSGMKKYYAEAGVPSARCHLVTDQAAAQAFIAQVGWPVIAKPDNGVGASHTWKLKDEADLAWFFSVKPDEQYVLEQYVEGTIRSYDAIMDSRCQPLFESTGIFPPSIADIVNDEGDLAYYVADAVPPALADAGRRTAKAFHAASRFVHLEFFELTKAIPGLGEVGDFVGLEVNMRPAGGYTPDMMDFAHNTDVYQIWADMAAFDERRLAPSGQDHFCAYASRRDSAHYRHSHEEVMAKYGGQMAMCERMPDALADAMGNQTYTIHAADEAAAKEFIRFVSERA